MFCLWIHSAPSPAPPPPPSLIFWAMKILVCLFGFIAVIYLQNFSFSTISIFPTRREVTKPQNIYWHFKFFVFSCSCQCPSEVRYEFNAVNTLFWEYHDFSYISYSVLCFWLGFWVSIDNGISISCKVSMLQLCLCNISLSIWLLLLEVRFEGIRKFSPYYICIQDRWCLIESYSVKYSFWLINMD